jgi:hypothetical protein
LEEMADEGRGREAQIASTVAVNRAKSAAPSKSCAESYAISRLHRTARSSSARIRSRASESTIRDIWPVASSATAVSSEIRSSIVAFYESFVPGGYWRDLWREDEHNLWEISSISEFTEYSSEILLIPDKRDFCLKKMKICLKNVCLLAFSL